MDDRKYLDAHLVALEADVAALSRDMKWFFDVVDCRFGAMRVQAVIQDNDDAFEQRRASLARDCIHD